MKKILFIVIGLAALAALIFFVKQKYEHLQNIESANVFWADFRKAVLTNDKKALSSMTSFPFLLNIGSGDSMEIMDYIGELETTICYRKEEFSLLFDVLLNLNDQEMYKFIKQTETIPIMNIRGDRFRIGCFYFLIKDGKWVYLGSVIDTYSNIFHKGMKGTPQQDIDEFYGKFRQAVISNDRNAIVSMTAFPFKVDSEDESTGESSILEKYDDGKSFLKVLDTFLEMDVGTSNTHETMRNFIKRNRTIDPNRICTEFDDFCDTGKFNFIRSLGKWYFSGITHDK